VSKGAPLRVKRKDLRSLQRKVRGGVGALGEKLNEV